MEIKIFEKKGSQLISFIRSSKLCYILHNFEITILNNLCYSDPQISIFKNTKFF